MKPARPDLFRHVFCFHPHLSFAVTLRIATEVLSLPCITTSHRFQFQTPRPFPFNPRPRATTRNVKRYEKCRWLRMHRLFNPHYQKFQLLSNYPPRLTKARNSSSHRRVIKRIDHRESAGSKNHVNLVQSMIARSMEKAGTSNRIGYTTCRAIPKRRTADTLPEGIVLRDAITQQYIMSPMTWKTRARRRHIACGSW